MNGNSQVICVNVITSILYTLDSLDDGLNNFIQYNLQFKYNKKKIHFMFM